MEEPTEEFNREEKEELSMKDPSYNVKIGGEKLEVGILAPCKSLRRDRQLPVRFKDYVLEDKCIKIWYFLPFPKQKNF